MSSAKVSSVTAIAGGWFGAHVDGTYVHRIRFPEADR
jgi:hypothetical protein